MADILVAENVLDLQDVLRRLFQRARHEVRVTGNGTDTLEQALEQAPDLLVMNPALPEIDGLEVCRRLRADLRTRDVPILILSVHQYPAEKDAARQAGADEYLGKPFHPAELLSRARVLLARNTG
ncbi:response regulator [Actinoplanes friuliensis]|uniref:Response regulator n=1 Tax=Actinoplanes friuliensis DSM 7358 TaxID=1246995 RepID=U5VUT1_9ACTN|nr:response regulator [Actinoplanes friuliensis]AGZ39495.1 response regulator [Actinoplanes friuliensis DSM 7358]